MSLDNEMKWKKDLVKDIRLHDHRDDVDFDLTENRNQFDGSVPQRPLPWKKTYPTSFGKADQDALLQHFLKIRDNCKFIMEIGVDRDGYKNSSTKILIENKRADTVYLGIDVEVKKGLDDPKNNVHTIQCRSENFGAVRDKINQLNVNTIDFLMIDGWHSINQVLLEWEYTDILADDGIVAFHDTRYHPGPHLFLNNLDKKKWCVVEDAIDKNITDWGIGFTCKRNLS